ncbi:hypothetical protein INR49_019323 [Caranx melampygus]|nr:hypothetical protein INR49_019323 [Caranx melampygus]
MLVVAEVGRSRASQIVPAAVSMFRYKSGRRPSLEPVLWFVACLGCLLVRSGAQEDSGTSSSTSSSLGYQDLCSYKWEAVDRDNNVSYTLKLCESSPPTACGPDAAVCARNLKTNTKQSRQAARQPEQFPQQLVLRCEAVTFPPLTNWCLVALGQPGTPEFVAVSQCVHYFEWRTYVACKKDKFKPHKEVGGGDGGGG